MGIPTPSVASASLCSSATVVTDMYNLNISKTTPRGIKPAKTSNNKMNSPDLETEKSVSNQTLRRAKDAARSFQSEEESRISAPPQTPPRTPKRKKPRFSLSPALTPEEKEVIVKAKNKHIERSIVSKRDKKYSHVNDMEWIAQAGAPWSHASGLTQEELTACRIKLRELVDGPTATAPVPPHFREEFMLTLLGTFVNWFGNIEHGWIYAHIRIQLYSVWGITNSEDVIISRENSEYMNEFSELRQDFHLRFLSDMVLFRRHISRSMSVAYGTRLRNIDSAKWRQTFKERYRGINSGYLSIQIDSILSEEWDIKYEPPIGPIAYGDQSGSGDHNSLVAGHFEPQVGLSWGSTVSLDQETLSTVATLNTNLLVASEKLSNANISIAASQTTLDALGSVGSNITDFAMLMLIIAIVCVVKPQTTVEKASIGALIFGFLASKGRLNAMLKSGIASVLSQGYSPQAGLSGIEDLSTVIVGLLSSYLAVQTGRQMFNPKDLVRVISDCGRMKLGVKAIMESLNTITAYVHSSIDSWYNDTGFFVGTGHEFIDCFMKEAKDILISAEEKRLRNMQSSLDRVRACIEQGESISLKIPGNTEYSGLRLYINNLVSELRKCKSGLISSNFMFAGLRVEPTALLMMGEPGVGKSVAMQHLSHAINALTLSGVDFASYSQDPAAFVYNRQAEQVYWDGYTQTKNIVIYDDLLQAREMQGNSDCESMNIIRNINIFENQLHMAALESKGNTTFRSKFVLANTNMRNFKFDAIHQPQAFLRRFDLVVDAVPREEYCVDPTETLANRRFNKDLLEVVTAEEVGNDPAKQHLIGTTKMHPDMLDFHLMKLDDGVYVPAGKILSFREIVFAMYQIYRLKTKWHDVYLHDLDRTLSKYRVEYRLLTEDEIFSPESGNDAQMSELSDPEDDFVPFVRLSGDSLKEWNQLRSDNPQGHVMLDSMMKIVLVNCYEEGLFACSDDLYPLLKTVLASKGIDIYRWIFVNEDTMDEITEGVLEMYRNPNLKPSYMRKWPVLKRRFDEWTLFVKNMKVNPDSWITAIYQAYKYSVAFILGAGGAAVTYFGNKTARLYEWAKYNLPTKTIMLSFVGGSSVLLAAYGVAKLIASLYNTEGDPESNERGGRTKVSRLVKNKNRVSVPQSVKFDAQSMVRMNENLTQIIQKVIIQSTFEVWVPTRLNGKSIMYSKLGYATGVKGRCLIMPYHFVSVVNYNLESKECMAEDVIILYRPGVQYREFSLTVTEFLDSFIHFDKAEEQDIAMLRLPKRFNPVIDILKYVATEKQVSRYSKIDGVLVIPNSTSQGSGHWRITELHNMKVKPAHNGKVGNSTFDDFTVRDLYLYEACTTNGDCGSTLYVNDKGNSSCIIGMHVAGSPATKSGFSTKLTRELLDEYCNIHKEDYVCVEADLNLDPPEDTPINMSNMGTFTAESAKAPHTMGVSKIIKSPLYGLLAPVTKAPAHLRPFKTAEGIVIDPMALSLSRYCEQDVYIPDDAIKSAVNSTFDMLESCSSKTVERKILTFEHAVLGDEDGDFHAVPRVTSAGYPYNVMPGPSSKERFFGKDVDYDLTTSECKDLENFVNVIIDEAGKRRRFQHIYTDVLKDERRSAKKVRAGETRLVSCCPTPLLIAFRMLFGAFQKWIIRNRIKNGIAIGINEYSSEWHMLSLELERFGTRASNIGAGDYRGYDMKHKNSVAWAVLQAINDWYDDEYRVVREILWLEIVNSYHVNGKQLYSWKTPLPSGAPPTSIFNCLVNHVYFRLCWIDIVHPLTYESHDFNEHAYLIVLGDDHVFCVDLQYKELFNERAVQLSMIKIGQEYTPEDKDKEFFDEKLRNLTDIVFLKRKFYLHPSSGTYMAPLDLDTIIDLPNWNKYSANVWADVETNCNTYLEELSLHPREVFEHWKKVLLRAVDSVEGLSRPPITDYNSLFRSVRNRDPHSEGELRFLTDYDELRYKYLGNQTKIGRFEEEKSGLFRLTSRTDCWQPQSSPGNQGSVPRLVQSARLNRTPTTLEATGLTNEGLLETQRSAVVTESSDTTNIVVDAETPISQMVTYKPLTADYLNSARSGTSQDIKSFLAKPCVVKTGTLLTSDTYANFKWTNVIPQQMLYANPQWSAKLSGNYAFKGTLHLTVQINATRFQAGRYILGWVPSGGAENNDKWFRMHAASLVQGTTVPHVEIDINCDSQATLIIPHVTCQGWAAFDQPGGGYYGNNGTVFFTAYSPLVLSTGSVDCGYNIIAHWEDVEVAMPIHPQSGDLRAKGKVKRRVKASEVEQEDMNIHGLSYGLSRLSTAANLIAGIPLLSSIAGPAGWALDILSNTAKSFGWSKPHNGSATSMMTRNIVNRFTNADTPDNSTKLGFMDCNEIEDLPGFGGSDLDEMSLNYVASISAWYGTLTWVQSQVASDVLLSQDISPKSYFSSTSTMGTTLSHLTPLAWVSSFFNMYRGSVKLTFKIVKTEFHTGRLMVMYYPYDSNVNAAYPALGITASGYCFREIIDIRYGNEFSFLMPWQAFTQYRNLNSTDAPYGKLVIVVLNELVAPANVPSSVSILVEACAGPDFEWAQPVDVSGMPVQSFVPQAGNVCEITTGTIGGAAMYEGNEAARLCAGERIRSFRTLLKRFTEIAYTSAPTIAGNYLNFNPFLSEVNYIDATVALSVASTQPDVYTWLSSAYAMARGSVRLKVVTMDPANGVQLYAGSLPGPLAATASNNYIWGSAPFVGSGYHKSMRPAAIQRPDFSGGTEVSFPYYNKTHSTANADAIYSSYNILAGNTIKPKPTGPIPRTTAYVYHSSFPTAANAPLIYRAGGEDCSFGLFVSVPPISGWAQNFSG